MFKKKTACSMKEITTFIMNEANEENMVELIKLMKIRKSKLDIENIAKENKNVFDKVKNL